LAKASLKVQRQREDFARKTANALVSSHDLIAYEHLQIRHLVKNRKLTKSIHDAAWGQFLNWVKAYGIMHDVPVIAVPPQYTSQDCSGCGERVKKTLSTRTHVCPSCGLVMDRDENAARNILAKALQGTLGHRETQELVSSNAWGEMTSTAASERVQGQASSWNQEPPGFSRGECQMVTDGKYIASEGSDIKGRPRGSIHFNEETLSQCHPERQRRISRRTEILRCRSG
jgi:putative transposase